MQILTRGDEARLFLICVAPLKPSPIRGCRLTVLLFIAFFGLFLWDCDIKILEVSLACHLPVGESFCPLTFEDLNFKSSARRKMPIKAKKRNDIAF